MQPQGPPVNNPPPGVGHASPANQAGHANLSGGPNQASASPPVASPAARKLAKWFLFTLGLIAATAFADWLSRKGVGKDVTAGELFGSGELYIVAIGLLVAAGADIVFDCLLAHRGRIYHGIVLAFCFVAILPISVAYGAAKSQAKELGNSASNVAAIADLQANTVQYSLWVLAGSIALSFFAVWLSEK